MSLNGNGRLHQYLLYLVIVIVGMLGWFLAGVSTKIDRIENIQSERKQRVESIAEMRTAMEKMAIQIATITTTDATLKRHEETLRRIEDRLNALTRRGDGSLF